MWGGLCPAHVLFGWGFSFWEPQRSRLIYAVGLLQSFYPLWDLCSYIRATNFVFLLDSCVCEILSCIYMYSLWFFIGSLSSISLFCHTTICNSYLGLIFHQCLHIFAGSQKCVGGLETMRYWSDFSPYICVSHSWIQVWQQVPLTIEISHSLLGSLKFFS